MGGRGRPGAAGKQRRPEHRPLAHAPAAPSAETCWGRPRSRQATGAGTRRVHTRTGCPARAGRIGPAALPGHPSLARPRPWPRPRTPRRPLRPRSGPAARQPQLRARLGSAGLGLLFGRDASSERRLTRGGQAGAVASALSTRSAPLSPSRLQSKRWPQDSPHRRPPGSPGQRRWPRRRPRVPQVPKAAEDHRRAEP